MTALNMVQALNRALGEALSEDDSVVLLGQDIGLNGGVFRVTEGRSLPGWFLANGCQSMSMHVNGRHTGCAKTLETQRFRRFTNPGAGVRFPPPPL